MTQSSARLGITLRGGLLKGRPPSHGRGDDVIGTARDDREAAGSEPGFAPLVGRADVSVTTMGGEVALNGMDASGACQRLVEVM